MLIPRDAWAVFRKDGLEVLRDRRTLFVNLFLPVLLYPLVLLFLLQVLQLTQAQVREKPRIGVIGASAEFATALDRVAGTGGEAVPQKNNQSAVGAALGPIKPGPFLIERDLPAESRLVELVAPVLHPPGGVTTATLPEANRREALLLLRQQRLAAAIIVAPGDERPTRLAILIDEANSRLDEVRGPIDQAIGAWRQQLVERSLTDGGVDPAVLAPIRVQSLGLAPAAEAVRTRIAGIIPWILVLLAAAAAFNPAIDLMAGERERGTLETLLSLPARRRDIVLGKLLVVCAAAFAAVILNLLSLGVSAVLLGAQVSAASGGASIDLLGSFGVGVSALLLCFVVLAPLIVAIAALSIGIAGFANSAKEAQNYLTPLLLVVMFAAIVVLVPTARPSFALDLVPITGAVLALKEALQSPSLPWAHLALATLANVALAAVIVGWSTKLLERESFRYPGLVRAGWGRWRTWWPANQRRDHAPGGLEVLIVFAVAVAGMTLGSGLLGGLHPVAFVVVPLIAFVAAPAIIHTWAGAYDARQVLGLRSPGGSGLLAALLLLPLGLTLSLGIGHLQGFVVDASQVKGTEEQMQRILGGVRDAGGIPLMILCLAVAPGICEELLCRGTLLTGLRRGVGTGWAVVLSAFLFAALHLSPLRFAPQMALGIALALITLRCRSVIPAMLLHMAHNGLLVGLEAGGLGEQIPEWVLWAGGGSALPLAVIGWKLLERPGPAAHPDANRFSPTSP